jgi:hypothetical protein
MVNKLKKEFNDAKTKKEKGKKGKEELGVPTGKWNPPSQTESSKRVIHGVDCFTSNVQNAGLKTKMFLNHYLFMFLQLPGHLQYLVQTFLVARLLQLP